MPSFSRKDAAGSTTSARAAVRDRKSSEQTTSSQRASASSTRVRSGSVCATSSPITHSARSRPSRAAANISGMRRPGSAGRRTPQAASNRARASGSATRA